MLISYVVLIGCALALGLAGWYAWRDRLIDDPLLLICALLTLGCIVQAAFGVRESASVSDEGERITYLAYAFTLPLVMPAVAFLAIKEKTRWSMAVVAAGAASVAVMTVRLLQIASQG